MIDAIAGNEAWLASGELRRALLSNPRLHGHALTRVLGALSLAELKLVEQMSAYPPPRARGSAATPQALISQEP